jgi:hypothetical protein
MEKCLANGLSQSWENTVAFISIIAASAGNYLLRQTCVQDAALTNVGKILKASALGGFTSRTAKTVENLSPYALTTLSDVNLVKFCLSGKVKKSTIRKGIYLRLAKLFHMWVTVMGGNVPFALAR